MALKTSLVITGDAASAKAALDSLDKGLADAGAEAKRLEKAFADADKSIEQLAAAQTRAQQETLAAKVALKAGSITAGEYNARLLETKTALSLVETGHRGAVNALKQAQTSLAGAKVSTGQAAAGYQNFGRQVQDVAVQMQSGTNLGTIISQQGGQIADAVAQMGGRFAGLASFLAGPWGAALIVGTGLLVNLGIELLSTGDAADESDGKARDFSKGLNVLELSALSTRDAVKALADEMRAAIVVQGDFTRTKALAARQSVADIEARLAQNQAALKAETDKAGIRSIIPFAGPDYRKIGQLREEIKLGREALAIARAGATDSIITEAQNRALEGLDKRTAATNNYKRAVGALQRQLEQSQSDPVGAAASGNYITPAEYQRRFRDLTATKDAEIEAAKKDGRTRRPPVDQTAKRAEYGEDTGKKIANIKDQFSDLPSAVTRANKAMRELDDISSDLARRPLTPNVKDLIAEVSQARGVVKESLNRPFNDFLEQSREAVEINKLLLAGRDDEAEALKIVLEKQRQQGPLQRDQLETVLATVRASREWSMVLRDQGEIIAANIGAVRDFRGALIGTVADALKGRFSVERILSSIGNSYVNIMSQKLVESLFGDTLRQLESQASGADKVDAAGVRIAASLDNGASAVEDFADRVTRSIATIEGGAGASAPDRSFFEDLFDNVASGVAEKVAEKSGTRVPETTGDEIVVTANKSRKVDLSGTGGMLIDMVDATFKRIGVGIPKVLLEGLKAPLAKLEQSLPQALQGAFTGSAASKLILGNGGSGVGGAIGGAIGQKMGEKFLSAGMEKIGGKLLGSLAGPLGGILGGVVGGLLGSALKTTTKGYAVVSNTGVSSGGNNKQLAANAQASGDSIQGALNGIADRLGATIGEYAVSIGMRSSGWVSVSGSGSSSVADKSWKQQNVGGDLLYDGKDPEQALKVAIQNAIQDGAIEGVSAAVKKALGSSSDIDTALREALKVADVELLIGGIGAQLEKSFKQFENQARERLRIAREYGFDLVKMEAQNAKDRLKLAEQLLKDQVGTLQDLIKEMTSGSLFEGSAVDQREKLLGEIAATKAKADAGEEGAADTLAQLLQKLNDVSKEAFGTTGGFASDRQTILDAARDTIAKANQRVTAAQAATDPAVVEALDENNDQNAQMLSQLGISNEYLKQLIAGLGGGAGVAGLAALAKTS